MPIADFSGRIRLGLRRRRSFRALPSLRHARRSARFVDTAHSLGMGVILDVVYNHFGPDGNYLTVFSDDYFTDRYKTNGATPINFDGPNSGPVREFFISNARYWIEEFHFDGFRFDATQSIFDKSEEHILAAIGKAARAAAGGRSIFFVAENEPQETRAGPSVHRGRLRARRSLERRPSSLRDRRADRAQPGLLHRLPGHAAGVHLGGEVRLPVSGPTLLAGRKCAAARPRSGSGRKRSSASSRITTRSRTPPRASAFA